eukprot:2633693-Rhodomonas_salina.1
MSECKAELLDEMPENPLRGAGRWVRAAERRALQVLGEPGDGGQERGGAEGAGARAGGAARGAGGAARKELGADERAGPQRRARRGQAGQAAQEEGAP